MQPGDTLWSLAARNNLTTRTVAAYNGVSEDGTLQVGQTVSVPTVDEGAVALQGQGVAPAAETAAAPAQTAAAPSAPSGGGGYTVQPGDTLSALAANAGVSVSELAAMNGLDPDGLLLAGTSLSVSGGSPAPAQASEPAAPQETAAPAPASAGAPTGQTVGASDIQSVAAQHGVSPSLAAAIAWQESGFNNAAVSSANARGVMQVMPGTWDDVQSNLASRPLDPNSAGDNVEAGVLYLKQLLRTPAVTRTPPSPATTRASAQCARAATTRTRISTSPTSRRCAPASAAEARLRARPAAGGRASAERSG